MKLFKYSAIAAAVSVSSFTTYADDTDLYLNRGANSEEKPKVMIVFDTSGSMGWKLDPNCWRNCDKKMPVAKQAMKSVIDANEDVEFGLARLHSGQGGYIVKGIGSDHSQIKKKIDNFDADGSTPISETLYEVYRYIQGGNLDQAKNVNGRDKSIDDGSKYTSPFASDKTKRCDNSVNLILMTDGDPTSDQDRDENIISEYTAKFSTAPTSLPGDPTQQTTHASYLHSLARLMHGIPATASNSGVAVDVYKPNDDIKHFARVYTVGFGDGLSKEGLAVLEQTAAYGGGQYKKADSASELSTALTQTINSIRQVSDTFASPAFASNNFDKTQSRDSLYYAMFYPSETAQWSGNLKKLKVSGDKVVATGGVEALNDSGAIKKGVTTFWAQPNTPPDGASIINGGVNSTLASATTSRNVFTYLKGDKKDFTYSNVVDALSEEDLHKYFSSDSAKARAMINWSIGKDAQDEDADGNINEMRQAIMGDPLHSKPLAIDYGNDIRILLGTNAGYVHMFKDNEATDSANNTVEESWAFIPQELFSVVKPLYNDSAEKVYGMDGPISLFFDDKGQPNVVDAGDRVWAYFAMRRGGSSYYAMDITDPDNPTLLWQISDQTPGFAELGQSWSRAEVIYANIDGYKDKPLLVFGAGYDTNKDNVASGADSKGRGIYIVDAETGKKVWSLTPQNGFAGNHSIVANIAYLDSDYDGYVDRLYAADLGGDVWRVDMPSSNPTDNANPWTHHKLAALGGSGSNRRFFYRPVVARTYFSKVTETTTEINGQTKTTLTRNTTPYEAILIGSGNRASPLDTTINDRLFMVRDENTLTQSFNDGLPQAINLGDLLDITGDPFANALDDETQFRNLERNIGENFNGWQYRISSGEKALASPTVVGGVAYFPTFKPASNDSTTNQCSLVPGQGGVYALHLHYGTKVYNWRYKEVGELVPDTPTVVWQKDGNNKSSGKIVLPNGVLDPKELVEQEVPRDMDGDGKIDLVKTGLGISLKTQQTYIYRREDNRDEF
ncbi:type IV fimbrial biogenesis protein PilY1 [Pseudoalteromonas sp. SW0106-04]|uniref:PilC/PilY family type IV pilus protein n=1 Tax=Pseudoalteromonas sp. SW0106-04 TaxID=1702169 RepID=UPI0006B528DB|nr:PilC/PilY family type IV pilus protein [Pseudoalteromonas sp. SW0106-04]GAP74861.1 type IV fimbrial biogenesis protein PilY1 [Pseudoalteromonas sp. SW0106-04]